MGRNIYGNICWEYLCEYLWEYVGKYGNIYGWLVVAITNLEKYDFVNGKDYISYMK